MNLAVLKPSRRPPRVGDVFVMRPPDGAFLWGRVVSTDANPLGVGGAILIYVHRARGPAKSPVPVLRADELLVPPMMTNRLPWSRGYFEHVETRPFGPGERLARHCFRDSRGRWFDETGMRVLRAVEPVGLRALHSFRTIDDAVSEALGIPLSPDE